MPFYCILLEVDSKQNGCCTTRKLLTWLGVQSEKVADSIRPVFGSTGSIDFDINHVADRRVLTWRGILKRDRSICMGVRLLHCWTGVPTLRMTSGSQGKLHGTWANQDSAIVNQL